MKNIIIILHKFIWTSVLTFFVIATVPFIQSMAFFREVSHIQSSSENFEPYAKQFIWSTMMYCSQICNSDWGDILSYALVMPHDFTCLSQGLNSQPLKKKKKQWSRSGSSYLLVSQAVKDIPWFSGRRKCIIARKKLTDTGSLLALTEEKELSTLTDWIKCFPRQ